MAANCSWFPGAPDCGNGAPTQSCQFADACQCNDGWSTNIADGQSNYQSYMNQCNIKEEDFATQAAATNRTIEGSGPAVIPAPPGAGGKQVQVNGGALALVVVSLLVIVCASCCIWKKWRRKRKRGNKKQRKDTDQRSKEAPLVHPFAQKFAIKSSDNQGPGSLGQMNTWLQKSSDFSSNPFQIQQMTGWSNPSQPPPFVPNQTLNPVRDFPQQPQHRGFGYFPSLQATSSTDEASNFKIGVGQHHHNPFTHELYNAPSPGTRPPSSLNQRSAAHDQISITDRHQSSDSMRSLHYDTQQRSPQFSGWPTAAQEGSMELRPLAPEGTLQFNRSRTAGDAFDVPVHRLGNFQGGNNRHSEFLSARDGNRVPIQFRTHPQWEQGATVRRNPTYEESALSRPDSFTTNSNGTSAEGVVRRMEQMHGMNGGYQQAQGPAGVGDPPFLTPSREQFARHNFPH